VAVSFRRVVIPDDEVAAVEFLCGNEWPFHARPRLSAVDASAIELVTADVDSYWATDAGQLVGLVRLLDLGDVVDGSPLFDLRIAEPWRGRDLGTQAVTWLTAHLFERTTWQCNGCSIAADTEPRANRARHGQPLPAADLGRPHDGIVCTTGQAAPACQGMTP
jgi:hypothetical protein